MVDKISKSSFLKLLIIRDKFRFDGFLKTFTEQFLNLKLIKNGVNLKDKILISLILFLNPLSLLFSEVHKKIGPVKIEKNKCKFQLNGENLLQMKNFDKKTKQIASNKKIDTFIDIGANIGKYTVILSDNANNIISIEPEHKNFSLLKKNIELNDIKNVEAIKVACYKHNGKKELYINESTTHTLHDNISKEKTELVDIITVDKVIKSRNIENIDLIKIDTEGTTLEIIKGSKKVIEKHKPILIFEWWTNQNLKRITEYLINENYKLQKHPNKQKCYIAYPNI